jgi:hypothetical protein
MLDKKFGINNPRAVEKERRRKKGSRQYRPSTSTVSYTLAEAAAKLTQYF